MSGYFSQYSDLLEVGQPEVVIFLLGVKVVGTWR
jgi:hypothetical protein